MLKPEQKCRVCKRSTEFVSAEILLQRAVSYFECQNCGFIQTEAPYWLEEAYTETINLSDTGIVARNLTNRKFVIPTLFALGGLHKKVVAAGFENDGSQAFFVTAFEAFEHFVDPRSELEKMLAKHLTFSFLPTLFPSRFLNSMTGGIMVQTMASTLVFIEKTHFSTSRKYMKSTLLVTGTTTIYLVTYQ